ncbi:CoA-binding protein [Deinococcus arenicola]|uniref:CoA-binding protein n=1 Tax=Deinococcus arenicola TaxID=2994950 RepID=A0ABU4DM96_9DEIO|nr:CoA-binding protein [Deinococcus sp. ZS9-10]MDV6373010.1 CoA-binding protein [Deinococcus sp. ZS9-10]
MTLLQSTPDVVRVLKENKVIAVVGFHHDGMKPAFYVPEYMHRQGYTVIPVNPSLAQRGETYFGHKAVATLAEITGPVDIVNIFRRSDRVPDHLDDILAMDPLPKVVWMQLGISNGTVARELTARGVDVVQDRCLLADHRALL